MRALSTITLFLLLTLSALRSTMYARADEPAAAPYVVIVHPSNASVTVSRQFLEDAFLKKVTLWPQGQVILPADLAASSRVRRKFTEEILRRSVGAVRAYWQQRIFSGRDLPPPEFGSDDEVVSYVLRHGGSIGYVSGGANLKGAKTLTLLR
jgi:hypothetical protein